ncbi:MAG: hypothetical protein RIR70_2240 [Pseudomonadota bacterium]
MRKILAAVFLMVSCTKIVAAGEMPPEIQAAIRQFLHAQPALSAEKFELEFPAWRGKSSDCMRPIEVSTSQPRLRGKVWFRVHCSQPLWSAMVVTKISLPGEYWVAERFLPVGTVLVAGDLKQAAADLAMLPDDLVRSEEEALGRVLVRAAPAGRPVLLNALRENAVVKAGEKVRINIQGSGFVVAGEAVALSNGAAGETVKLKLRDGRQLQGRVVKPGLVETNLE